MVGDIFSNTCQPKNNVFPNECINEQVQADHLCLDNEYNPQTPSICFDDDLINQSISYIPNSIILEPNRQIQPQDYGSSQIFHSYTYREEVDYPKKYGVDLYSSLYDKVCYDDVISEWSNLIDEDSFDMKNELSFEDLNEVDKYL
jgi:hypothetical protein